MEVTIELTVNGKKVTVKTDPSRLLLDVLREDLRLSGTKHGCGEGLCGACTVLMDGKRVLSCMTPVSRADGKTITTIEGMADGDRLHPVQQAWLEEDVPQCGYCQTGLIMTTVEFLQNHPSPSDEDINANIDNLCRCGTYVRVRKAIHRAAELTAKVK